MSALTPVYTVGDQIAEAITVHRPQTDRRTARGRAVELLELVGIAQPERRAKAFPHELSGGERQRVVIAMAIANDPDLLICDEPTTALDVTVQAQILDVLRTARDVTGAGVLIITHDLGVVAEFADRARGDVRGPRRRDGVGGHALPGSPNALHRRVVGLGATPGRTAGQPAGPDTGSAAGPGRTRPRLPVRAALSAGHRRVPDRRTGVGDRRRQPHRRVHPHRGGGRAQRGRHLRGFDRTAPHRRRRRPPAKSWCGYTTWEDLPADQGCGVPSAHRRRPCRRRRQLRTPPWPDVGDRRRVRVGQVDDAARDPRTPPTPGGNHRGARQRCRDPGQRAATGAAPRPAGGFPGSGRLPGSPVAGVRHTGGTVAGQRFRQERHPVPGG